MPRPLSTILLAAILAASLPATGSAQAPPASGAARQNVQESEQYDRLVCTNAAFRAKHIAEECGPIGDPQLHAQCVASFNCGKPASEPDWRQAPPSETIR